MNTKIHLMWALLLAVVLGWSVQDSRAQSREPLRPVELTYEYRTFDGTGSFYEEARRIRSDEKRFSKFPTVSSLDSAMNMLAQVGWEFVPFVDQERAIYMMFRRRVPVQR